MLLQFLFHLDGYMWIFCFSICRCLGKCSSQAVNKSRSNKKTQIFGKFKGWIKTSLSWRNHVQKQATASCFVKDPHETKYSWHLKDPSINTLKIYTLPETNIAPENGWLEYYFPIGEAYFQGLLLLASGRVKIPTQKIGFTLKKSVKTSNSLVWSGVFLHDPRCHHQIGGYNLGLAHGRIKRRNLAITTVGMVLTPCK